jgi:hypothetical protein
MTDSINAVGLDTETKRLVVELSVRATRLVQHLSTAIHSRDPSAYTEDAATALALHRLGPLRGLREFCAGDLNWTVHSIAACRGVNALFKTIDKLTHDQQAQCSSYYAALMIDQANELWMRQIKDQAIRRERRMIYPFNRQLSYYERSFWRDDDPFTLCALIESLDWIQDDERSCRAYVASLLADLAYTYITTMERSSINKGIGVRKGRSLLVPSGAFRNALRAGPGTANIQIDGVESFTVDVGAEGDGDDNHSAFTCVVLIHKNANVMFVCVRGTAHAYDWRVNLRAGHYFAAGAQDHRLFCHRGFMEESIRIQGSLFQRIQAAATSSTAIVFVGHSLGGAAAALLTRMWNNAPRASSNGHPPAQCYTFGAPRYQNRPSDNWVVGLTSPIDPVPYVPFSVMGYHTVLDEYSSRTLAPTRRMCDRMVLDIAAFLSLNVWGIYWGHRMDAYRRRVRSAALGAITRVLAREALAEKY